MCKYGCDDCAFADENVPNDLHEYHITVSAGDASPKTMQHISNESRYLGLKMLVIELGNKRHSAPLDYMITGRMRGTCHDALAEAWTKASMLASSGIRVLRVKIESTLTNKEAINNALYFETHIAINIADGNPADIKRFPHWVHFSRNKFKQDIQMATIRTTINAPSAPEDHSCLVHKTVDAMRFLGYKIDKVINEVAWYDNNIEHDNEWLQKEKTYDGSIDGGVDLVRRSLNIDLN